MRAVDPPGGGRSPSEVDRATLVRCKAQDPVAFQAFVVRYERLVFAVLSQMLGRGAHVEDLAQETFLRAYLAFPRFELDLAKPSRWVLTIATRLALNEARGLRARPTTEEKETDDATQGAAAAAMAATPETESLRAEMGRAIERAIAQLPDEQRAVFVLAELHDLTLAEIAAALGVPVGTVKSRLLRAREDLRGRLERLRKRGTDE
jgi:RNA polymerase sigma-70 factor (ECF subfamily)